MRCNRLLFLPCQVTPKRFGQEEEELPWHVHEGGAIGRLWSPVLGSRSVADPKKTMSKHCAPALLTIRCGFLRNIWYLDTHVLLKQVPISFTTYLEKTGGRFAKCSISSGLGSVRQSDTGSSPRCLLQPPCNSVHC